MLENGIGIILKCLRLITHLEWFPQLIALLMVRSVFPGHILMLKILVQHLQTLKLARGTILLVREWYRDHFAVVEAHDPPGMVLMMKFTNYGKKGVPRPYFDVENLGTTTTYVKIGQRNHSLSTRMV